MCLAFSMALLAGCGALSGNKVETLNMEGFKSAMSDGNTVIVDTRGDSVYNGLKVLMPLVADTYPRQFSSRLNGSTGFTPINLNPSQPTKA